MNKNMLGLSNFYEDRSPKGKDYSKLSLMYQDIYKMMSEFVAAAGNNFVIPMLETYKKIPSFNFDPTPGQYSLNEILTRSDVASKLGSNTVTETTSSRVEKWLGLGTKRYSVSEKISVLDYLGLYCNIYAYEGSMSTTYKVVDANLLNYDFSRFSKGVDYVLKDNRLYLFNGAAVASPKVKYFTLENVFVDKMNVERRLGIYVGLEQPECMTRNEYRELVQIIYYVVTMGPTIKNIEMAIQSITGLEEARVLDRFSADRSRLDYWTDLSRGDRLKDFDFLISIPEMDQHDINKLMAFIGYIKLVKPSDSDFIFARSTAYYDVLHMTRRDAKTRLNVRGLPLDKLGYSDNRDLDVFTNLYDKIRSTEAFSAESNVKKGLVDIGQHGDYWDNSLIVVRPNNFIVADTAAMYNKIGPGSHLGSDAIVVVSRSEYDQLTENGEIVDGRIYIIGDEFELLSDVLKVGDVNKSDIRSQKIEHFDYEGQMNKFTFDQTHADGSYFQYDSANIMFDGEDRLTQSHEAYRDMVEVRLIKNT